MNAKRLTEIRERWAAATPGPWEECGAAITGCECGFVWSSTLDFPVATTDIYSAEDGFHTTPGRKRMDAIAIAAAPTDIADLLAEVERLHCVCDTLQGEIDDLLDTLDAE